MELPSKITKENEAKFIFLKGVPSCKTANIIFIVYTANKHFYDCVFMCMYINV